jgi:hypothetical protein
MGKDLISESWRLGISIKNTNRFEALECLRYSKDINRAWKTIKANIKASAKWSLGLYELTQQKPLLDEEYLGFFRSKEAGLNAVVTGSKPKQRR